MRKCPRMSNRTCSSSGSSERGRKRARSTKEIQLLFWERDLPFPNSLLGEVRRWQSLWRAKSEEGANLPHNLLLSFRFCDADAFPNIYRLLLIACTLPITSAEAERSFSLMRRLKTYARSTMSGSSKKTLPESIVRRCFVMMHHNNFMYNPGP